MSKYGVGAPNGLYINVGIINFAECRRYNYASRIGRCWRRHHSHVAAVEVGPKQFLLDAVDPVNALVHTVEGQVDDDNVVDGVRKKDRGVVGSGHVGLHYRMLKAVRPIHTTIRTVQLKIVGIENVLIYKNVKR